jgi:hypothetical protein
MKPELIWPATLGELQLQMTQATFDTWLRGSTLQEYRDGVFVVGVKSGYAKDWLEHRLLATIKRTLARLTGQPVEIQFVVGGERGRPGEQAAQEGQGSEQASEPRPGEIAVELVEFDPTRKGFVMATNYAIRFWQPYLGAVPFALWLALRSFAFRADRESWPSIQTLADICTNGNRHVILGRNERKGRERTIGALEVLENERIVWPKKYGVGHETRYRFRVLENLPLLTPVQVQKLTPLLRRAHARFVADCPIDYEEWSRLTLPTLAEVAESDDDASADRT